MIETTIKSPAWLKEPEDLANWSSKTSRMAALHQFLPLTIYRKEAKEFHALRFNPDKASRFIWSYSSRENAALKQAEIASLVSHLYEERIPASLFLEQLPSNLSRVCEKRLSEGPEALDEKTALLAKDFFSAQFSSIQESFVGNDGVLLLHSVRAKNKEEKAWAEDCVLKWTSNSEVASGDVLKLIFTDTQVPEASIINFATNTILGGSFPPKSLTGFQSVIQGNLHFIREIHTKKELNATDIMISQLAPGANLGDFAANKWIELAKDPVSKEKIYATLGEIFLGDLLLGNTDRLFAVSYPRRGDPARATFDSFTPANIGNLLIDYPSSETGSLTVYAIDNEAYVRNSTCGSDYPQYNDFVDSVLGSPDWAELAIDTIISSLSLAITDEFSPYFESKELSEDEREIEQEKFKPFLDDINTPETRQSLALGLHAAKMRILTKVDSEEFTRKIGAITEKYDSANLCDAVLERIKILQNHRDIP